jgi:Fe-S-cluster containining protein
MTEVEDKVADLFRSVDAGVVKALDGRPVSCTKGCDHCCYQLVGIGVGEALYIAAYLTRLPSWREWAKRLFRDAYAQTLPRMDKTKWFDNHTPCTFLGSDHLCRIYDRRPAACRYHFVRTPPENCALGAKDPHTERYDTGEAAGYLNDLDRAIWEGNPELGRPGFGTLPHLVLWAMQFCVKRDRDAEWLYLRASSLPTPQQWTEAFMKEQPGLSALNARDTSLITLKPPERK